MLTIQLSARPGEEDRLQAWLSEDALPALATRAGLCGAHLLLGDQSASETKSQEKELRGVPDGIADRVLLVEGYDRTVLEHAQAELQGVNGLVAHGAAEGWITGMYSLGYTLGEDEAKAVWRKP